MEADLKSESGRASRYLAVRYTGKGLNWSTTLALVWWLGEIWMWYIFAVTILIEYCFDFWTQKLWAFRDPREGLRVLLMQFRFYLLVRASIAALTGAVVYLILTALPIAPVAALVCAMLIVWPLSFAICRKLFFGGEWNDLPKLVKKSVRRWRRTKT
jgi:putative flippase GtrA